MGNIAVVHAQQRACYYAERWLREYNCTTAATRTAAQHYRLKALPSNSSSYTTYVASLHTRRGRKLAERYLGMFSNLLTSDLLPGQRKLHATYRSYELTCSIPHTTAQSATALQLLRTVFVEEHECADVTDTTAYGVRVVTALILPTFDQLHIEVF